MSANLHFGLAGFFSNRLARGKKLFGAGLKLGFSVKYILQ
jgi:hypothetical protein